MSVSIDKIGDYAAAHFSWLEMGNFPPAFYVSSTLLVIAFCGGFRLLYRMGRYLYRTGGARNLRRCPRVMIIGAGDMGMIIVRELQANAYRKGKPVVIVDDDEKKQGKRFCGVPVRGGTSRIPEIAARYNVDEIIFCIPSAPSGAILPAGKTTEARSSGL